MNIFIAGSSSILAAELVEHFFRQNDTIFLCDELPQDDTAISAALETTTAGQSMDVVIVLHGEDVLYNDLKKFRRGKQPSAVLQQTWTISQFFSEHSKKPQTLLLTSSVNIYGAASQETVDENSSSGNDYVADYFSQLEAATRPAENSGIRVVHMRLGAIICRSSRPALPRLPFLPASIDAICYDGKCRISWISREDALSAVNFLLENEELTSPVIITSGDFPSRKEFFKSLKKNYNINLMLPIPKSLLQCIIGKHRAAMYCMSAMAMPTKLLQAGFLTSNISLPEYLSQPSETSETTG